MAIWKTYFDKNNTIIKDDPINTARNPIAVLSYGSKVSRFIFYCDFNDLIPIYSDNNVPVDGNSKHILKIKNTANFDVRNTLDYNNNIILGDILSPSNFTVELHKIDEEWAEGYGYVFNKSEAKDNLYSEEPSNWTQNTTLTNWNTPGIISGSTNLITTVTFNNAQDDIEIDITSFVNELLQSNFEGYQGFCLKFIDELENKDTTDEYAIGLYTKYTNTFFQPHIESYIPTLVKDDRFNGTPYRQLKLFMYSVINGELTNLDEMPDATFDGDPITVNQAAKGSYYIEVDTTNLNDHQEYTDEWSNLIYQGVSLPNKRFKLVLNSPVDYYNITDSPINRFRYTSVISGINKGAKIKHGNIFILPVFIRRMYDHASTANILGSKLEYMIYVKQGNNKVIFIDWDECDRIGNRYEIKFDTRIFPNQKYYIDLRFTCNSEVHILEEQTNFEIQ